ncbi:hypothetical protein B9Z55_023975 [Caenorhabditis nigoni]|uniref:SPK domain-containing protein n=1 Tax=Caenorhabditis nigoni TaxID=1611254 RepID=A0A2G5SSV4_9PELO|nr:hypothetical protein B9Z55_023975 [Caenorhabditis nigoni]
MDHTIKTEPNHGNSPPPIQQFLIKEKLIEDSYSWSVPENTSEVDDEWLSEIYCGMVKNDSFRDPIRSLTFETAQTENLQLKTREEDVQEDNVVEEMYRTIESDPNHEYSLPPLRQTLIKEELIDNSYSFPIRENTVKRNRINETVASETCDEMSNNEFFRTPLRSFMSNTAHPEEHLSTGNAYMQLLSQNNLVTASFNAFFPTQVPEQTIKREPISENLQLTTREENSQRDNLIMIRLILLEMIFKAQTIQSLYVYMSKKQKIMGQEIKYELHRTIKTDANPEFFPPPLRQSLTKEELIDDSYSLSIRENTVEQGAIDKRLESKIISDTAQNEDHFLPGNAYMQLLSENNLAIPSFNGLFPTQISELTTKKESTSEKRHEKNNEDDFVVEEWDASSELDQLSTSDNSDFEEATLSQKSLTGSTRRSFTQWHEEWDNLIMNEFFQCRRKTKGVLGFKNIAEAFLKKHNVGLCFNAVIMHFKRVFKKRLRDPNVPEEEKTRMQKATKSWKMTKRYQEELLNKRRSIERIFNTTTTSVTTTQWSNSWNEIIMDEFMKIAMDESLEVFSVNKFCEKFKDDHQLAIPISRLVKNFKEAFNGRLNDVHVELESKLKMLLKFKTKVPLELTNQ